MQRGDDMLLPWLTLGWFIPAVAVSTLELSLAGRLDPLVIALDSIAVMLLPFGLLSLYLSRGGAPGDTPPSDEDDGGGRGGPGRDLRPEPPTGGLEIDWDRFEADLRAWSEARMVGAGTGA